MSPNIHRHPEVEPIEAMLPELELSKTTPSEPKMWDTSDINKYTWARANQEAQLSVKPLIFIHIIIPIWFEPDFDQNYHIFR